MKNIWLHDRIFSLRWYIFIDHLIHIINKNWLKDSKNTKLQSDGYIGWMKLDILIASKQDTLEHNYILPFALWVTSYFCIIHL